MMDPVQLNIFQDYVTDISGVDKSIFPDILAINDIVGDSKTVNLQVNGRCQINNYVGFYSTRKVRIQILPKIYAKTPDVPGNRQETKESLFFLFKLLRESGYLKIKELPSQLIDQYEGDLLEIFIRLFIQSFLKEFNRNYYRKYEIFEEGQQFIRGKILVSETLKRNPFTKHIHHVRYEELSVDNPLNRIFKFVIKKLIKVTTSSDNKKLLKLGLIYLEDVSSIEVQTFLLERIRFNRQNISFRPIFNLAKLFYFNLQPGLSKGEEDTFSFLVKVHELYQHFLFSILEECYPYPDFHVKHESPSLPLATKEGKEVWFITPDFTISKDNDQFVYILDAKYKFPFNNGKPAPGKNDIYQMLAYANKYRCKKLALIYPKFKNSPFNHPLIAEYRIDTPFGDVQLKIIQIDITCEDKFQIKNELLSSIEINELSEFV